MKVRLQQILSVLCVLALALGGLSGGAMAEQSAQQTLLTIEWADDNNRDGLRPENVSVDGKTLNAANAWTAVVTSGSALPDVTGYTVSGAVTGDLATVTYSHTVETVDFTGSVSWNDGGNAKQTRPGSVKLQLLQNGNPYGAAKSVSSSTGAGGVTWEGLPKFRYGTREAADYSVQPESVPAGYEILQSSADSVTFGLLTGSLKLDVSVSGAPEGADLSGLQIRVKGADQNVTSQVTGTGSFDLGTVIAGAFLAEDLNASELLKDDGYVLDGDNSTVCDAVMLKGKGEATMKIHIAYKKAEAMDPENTPDPYTNVGNLTFEVLGPSFEDQPLVIQYSEFSADGTYTIPNVLPGFYVVVEKNAGKIVEAYSLISDSTTSDGTLVIHGEQRVISLFNHYQPAPTPEPDAETVDVPVIKTWNDNNNADGNRPASVTVRLLADNTEINSVTLNEGNSWRYTFEGLPRYTEEEPKKEIVYTITEDAVPMYRAVVRGYSVLNEYEPEVVSATVSKNWNDNNNANGERPIGIAVSLYDDFGLVRTVVLSDENGWTTTLNNLPAVRNGQRLTYSWTEQQIVGYVQQNAAVDGNNASFTNTAWERPPVEEAKKPKKAPGNQFFIFEEYETPLGVEVMINHVGDCFD